jgi:hypothetical protein
MAQIKLQADGLNLADTFAFSGTVTGAGETNTSFQVKHVAGQTTTHATLQKILFDTVKFDTASGYDTANDRYVVQTGDDGKWLFWWKQAYDTNNDNSAQETYLYKNGANVDTHCHAFDYDNSIACMFALDLAATDYVEVFTIQYFGEDTLLCGASDQRASSFGGMLTEA